LWANKLSNAANSISIAKAFIVTCGNTYLAIYADAPDAPITIVRYIEGTIGIDCYASWKAELGLCTFPISKVLVATTRYSAHYSGGTYFANAVVIDVSNVNIALFINSQACWDGKFCAVRRAIGVAIRRHNSNCPTCYCAYYSLGTNLANPIVYSFCYIEIALLVKNQVAG
jgi:hypothetical protein